MSSPPDFNARQLVKLREFSTQLAERLREAPGLPIEPTRLAVRVGDANYLIDMGLAGGIVPLPEVAPVPWTKPWYRGLANVRGRLVGVVDGLQLTGRAPLSAEHGQQLLVFGDALGVNAALLITRAFGIRSMKDLTPLDAVADASPAWERARYRDKDGAEYTELDLRELVRSPAFAAIGA